jgi:hypothetical protein
MMCNATNGIVRKSKQEGIMAGKTSVPSHFGSILVGRKVRDDLNIR